MRSTLRRLLLSTRGGWRFRNQKLDWGSERGAGFEEGTERVTVGGECAGSTVLGRPRAPVAAEGGPSGPLTSGGHRQVSVGAVS